MRRKGPGDRALHRLSDHAFVFRETFSSAGVLIFPRAAVAIDTLISPRAARRMQESVARLSDAPFTHAVNTHYHGDHVGGNAAFAETGTEIIAGARTAAFIRERDGERLEYVRTFGLAFHEVPAVSPPTRTFNGELTLRVGNETLELSHLGASETPDAIVVFWPRERVAFTGDAVATFGYPWTGVPFLDEGLQPDGEWERVLARVEQLRPEILVPGHGPPLLGRKAISRRLALLRRLFGDLFTEANAAAARGGTVEEMAARAAERLRHYRRRHDMEEIVVSQRFSIYKALNGLLPGRRGRGWWFDLRPSVLPSDEEGPPAPPGDAGAWGSRAFWLFDRGLRHRPFVDASELWSAAARMARAALAAQGDEPQALLTLGAHEVWGAMVLAQSMEPAINKLSAALGEANQLTPRQARVGAFFLGKAHQVEGRARDADHWFRRALPAALRWAYPAMRRWMWSLP